MVGVSIKQVVHEEVAALVSCLNPNFKQDLFDPWRGSGYGTIL